MVGEKDVTLEEVEVWLIMDANISICTEKTEKVMSKEIMYPVINIEEKDHFKEVKIKQ